MFQVSYLSPVLALIGGIAVAQTQIDLRTQSKGVDFQAAPYTRAFKTTASLPATCKQNELIFLTSSPAGSNIYGCTSPNVWALEGGTQSLSIQNGGTSIGTESTLNFVSGLGTVNAVTDIGGKINIQQAADTAVLLSKASHQSGTALLCQSTGGSGGDYNCAMTPTLTAYTTGMVLQWKPDVTSADTTVTLNVDVIGAAAVREADGVSGPVPGEIVPGMLYQIWYDGTVFRLPPVTASPSAQSSGTVTIPTNLRKRGFQIAFGGTDAVVGSVIYVTMPYSCTAAGYVLSADPAGTATIKLWKTADGSAVPTSANSISSNGFSLSTGSRIHSSDLADLSTTGWAAYDTTAVYLSAVSGNPNHVSLMLECNQ